MADLLAYNSQLISSLLSGNGGISKGCFGGLIPDADVSGGFQLMVCGVGKNPLNTPITALVNGGGYGRKPGQQALISKIAAQIASDFSKATQQSDAFKQTLAHDVQQAAITHGLPRDVGNSGSSGGRNV